ncbi:hypothetical protein F5887DRAFT_901467, partial [Amanita rubescens]
ELESVLLTHPDIADAAVIRGNRVAKVIDSKFILIRYIPRAYVVHAKPEAICDQYKKLAFCGGIESLIQKQVTRHKYLRKVILIVNDIVFYD